MTKPFKWGAEFLVNTTTTAIQNDPAVAALADGRFVVTWVDLSATGDDTSLAAIRAQVFNADGTRLGGEFVVNTATSSAQVQPAITTLADGRFVISWSDNSQTGGDTSVFAVRAQAFNPDGTPSGAEFRVNTTTFSAQFQPTITGLVDGRFVVAWTDLSASGGDTTGFAIRAQMYNANGTASGAEVLVNTITTGDQSEPSITALSDGGYIICWTNTNAPDDEAGTLGISAQVFDADGARRGSEFQVNGTIDGDQKTCVVTALAGGGYVVGWFDESTAFGDNDGGIVAAIFDANGTIFNLIPVNDLKLSLQSEAAITALATGDFVVSWSDGGGAGVLAHMFDAGGNRVGGTFAINSSSIGTQGKSTITALADGRFLASWTDDNPSLGDTSGSSIRAQIFDPRVAAVTLNGTLAADSFYGTVFADQMAGSFGDDTLTGEAGDDRLEGEFGADKLQLGLGNDRAYGGDGADSLLGAGGSDVLEGGAGNDTLTGGAGADAAMGGTGNDLYVVDSAADLVIEAAGASNGNDTVRTGDFSLQLDAYANVENASLSGALALNLTGTGIANALIGNTVGNLLSGKGGADTLTGQGGADTLDGGTGQDRLSSGSGADVLSGGGDADTFVFASVSDSGTGAKRDTITDFAAGSDKLDLSGFMAGGTFIGAAAPTPGNGPQVRYVAASGILSGDVDGDGTVDFQIQLDGAPPLTAADILF